MIRVDDGKTDPSKSLDLAAVREHKFLTAFDAVDLIPKGCYSDPFGEKFGEPETYWFRPRAWGRTPRARCRPGRRFDRFCTRLAAAADMPVSQLMGDPPPRPQRHRQCGHYLVVRPHLGPAERGSPGSHEKQLLQVLFAAKKGPIGGKEPENWSIRFRPIHELSPLEEADRRLKIAQADAAWVAAQVLAREEVAVSRFGGDEFSAETTIDLETRARIAEDDQDDLEDEAHGSLIAGRELEV